MNKVVASVVGASVLLATTVVASAQRITPPTPPSPPAPGQTLQAPYVAENPDQGSGQSKPLFSIGQVPVVVWAPVQPHYSSRMNGTQAANAQLRDADAY